MKDILYDRDYNEQNEEIKKERRNKLYKIARQEGYNIEKEYLDYDKYNKGEKLKELEKDIEAGKVKNVIVSSLDRLSRNMPEAMHIIDKIERNNGHFLFLDTTLKEISTQERAFMKYFLESQRKSMVIKRRFSRDIEFNEELFNTIKDKPIKLGYLIGYVGKGNIITNNEEILGQEFDEFSPEQLEVKVIPQKIIKDEENYLNIVVKFEKELDKDLFKDRLLQVDFAEDDEMEM